MQHTVATVIFHDGANAIKITAIPRYRATPPLDFVRNVFGSPYEILWPVKEEGLLCTLPKSSLELSRVMFLYIVY